MQFRLTPRKLDSAETSNQFSFRASRILSGISGLHLYGCRGTVIQGIEEFFGVEGYFLFAMVIA